MKGMLAGYGLALACAIAALFFGLRMVLVQHAAGEAAAARDAAAEEVRRLRAELKSSDDGAAALRDQLASVSRRLAAAEVELQQYRDSDQEGNARAADNEKVMQALTATIADLRGRLAKASAEAADAKATAGRAAGRLAAKAGTDPVPEPPPAGGAPGSVRGKGFLRTSGGKVRTAAGLTVLLIPAEGPGSYYRGDVVEKKEAFDAEDHRVTADILRNVADDTGAFGFADVPPGDYFAACWIRVGSGGTWAEAAVHVDAGAETVVNLTQ